MKKSAYSKLYTLPYSNSVPCHFRVEPLDAQNNQKPR